MFSKASKPFLVLFGSLLISFADCGSGKGGGDSGNNGGHGGEPQPPPITLPPTLASFMRGGIENRLQQRLTNLTTTPPDVTEGSLGYGSAVEGNDGRGKGGQRGNRQGDQEDQNNRSGVDRHPAGRKDQVSDEDNNGKGQQGSRNGTQQGGQQGKRRKPQDDDTDYQAWRTSRDQRGGRNNKPPRAKNITAEDDSDDDDDGKYDNFQQNRAFIQSHQQRRQRGEVNFDVALNDMADMNTTELTKRLGFKKSKTQNQVKTTRSTTKRPTTTTKLRTTTTKRGQQQVTSTTVSTTQSTTTTLPTTTTTKIPSSLDLRSFGALSQVRDQQECGACWAFSAAAALEGRLAMKTGQMLPLSVQSFLDCSTSFGNAGCDGGDMSQAFDYIKAAQGDNTYVTYPYAGKANDKCTFDNRTDASFAPISGYVELPDRDQNAISEALQTGPVSAAMDAGLSSFYYYATGVYYDPMCDPQNPNHAVLIIGYGIDNKTSKPYWLIKNTWGTTWGEQGYAKVERGRNACGIETGAIYPVLL